MTLKIFKNQSEPQCAFCEHGNPTPDGKSIVCRKIGGVMQPFSKCRKYKYDPFKREPRIITFSNDFSEKDFEI